MKPIFLEIEGFNSFREVQKINFKKLVDKGFFGIFGPTGSGKSSILDAIIYALYGKLDREFINLNEDKAVIKYTFEIGGGSERKTYHIHRVVKRDKDGAYKAAVVKLYQIVKNNDEESLEIIGEGKSNVDARVMEIIGLKQTDFTRAVVLPQGKFSEFLKISAKDRSDMLERLFGLQKYGSGLVEKLKREIQKNNIELIRIEGQLSSYQDISEYSLKELKLRYENLKEEEKNLKKEKLIIDENYEKYKNIWFLQKELEAKEKQKEEYDFLKTEVEKKKEKVQKALAASTVRPYIDALEEAEVKFKKVNSDLDNSCTNIVVIKNKTEEIRKGHKTAFSLKEKEVPELNKKEANINQAIKLKDELKLFEEEVANIRKEKELLAASKEKIETELNKNKSEVLENKNKIFDYEQRIKSLNVSAEERQKINEGLETEKNLYRVNDEFSKLQENYRNQISELNIEENLLKESVKRFEAVNAELEANKSELDALNRNCPGDNNKVLEKSSEVNAIKGIYEKNIESFNLKIEKEKQYAGLKDKFELSEKAIDQNNCEAEIIYKQLNIEKEQLEKLKIDNYAGIIASKLKEEEPCPVCGNIHREKLAKIMDINIISKKEASFIKLETQYSDIQADKLKIQKEFVGAEVNYKNIEKELNLLAFALGNFDIDAEKSKIKALIEDYNNYKLKVEQWNADREKSNESIANIEKIRNKAELEKVKLAETIKKEKEITDNSKKILEEKKEELTALQEKYTLLKIEIKAGSFQICYNGIVEGDKKLSLLEKELQYSRNSLEQSENIIKTDNEKMQVLINQITANSERLNQKLQFIERQNKEIHILSEGKDPYSYQEEIFNRIQSIVNKEKLLKETLEKEIIEGNELEKSIAALTKEKYNLHLDIEKNQNYLNAGLKETGFSSMEEAKNAYMLKTEIETAQKDIKDFEDSYFKLLNSMEEIHKKLGVRIEADKWEEVQLSAAAIEHQLEVKVGEVSAVWNEIEKMKASLERLKEVLAERDKYTHKKHLLNELERNFKGNKFVEFVAQSQLKYVTAEASKRLSLNTNDKYELKLTEEGEFYIKDNSSGGLLRSTNSLSGGELFLASLALALALSSHIQLKGSASLEFFFLDEGFGTLDDELLDTVMNSLENLHTERLSVGIISHVKELKERVPIKIVVTPSSFGVGSSISIDPVR